MLWIPGPTEVRHALLEELLRPMIGHRSRAMTALLERIDPGLRLAFGLGERSRSTVAVGTHSATAMMEGALHGVGPRVLCVANGAFAERWAEIATTVGKEVTTLEVPWGDAVVEAALARTLQERGPFDAVTVVVNETSTGVYTPLERLSGALGQSPGTKLLVDVVSGLAGYPIDFDRHRIDFALAGINKALALPPGLTVMCASERYLEEARSRERSAWYLDPVRTFEGHVTRKTPCTPCIPLYRALAQQLEDIGSGATLSAEERGKRGAEAWAARYEKHRRMRRMTLDWAAARGLAPFPRAELSSPTISCLAAGELDVPALIAGLKEQGHEIGNGYGKLKDVTFRIGHMGDHDEQGLGRLLAAADRVLG